MSMPRIAGVGMTAFGRHHARTLSSLAEEASRIALDNAGLSTCDVDAVMVGNAVQGAIEGQHGIRGQLMFAAMDFGNVPIINVENACASASTAFHLAISYIQSGSADVVLAVGAEKMVTDDKTAGLAAFDDPVVAGLLCPMGRPAQPEEIAACCLFFASDDSSYCNGACLEVDGGTTSRMFALPQP